MQHSPLDSGDAFCDLGGGVVCIIYRNRTTTAEYQKALSSKNLFLHRLAWPVARSALAEIEHAGQRILSIEREWRRKDPTMNNLNVVRMSSDQQALEKIVKHAFHLLPAFRRVFLLCDIRGFTVEEAAARLGISPNAAQARLHRARREMNIRLATES